LLNRICRRSRFIKENMGERLKASAVVTPGSDYGETSRAQGKKSMEHGERQQAAGRNQRTEGKLQISWLIAES